MRDQRPGQRRRRGALPLVALVVLHVSAWQVSLLAALSGAAAAALALPLGPAIERRRKRPVLVTADLVRAAALVSVPVAAALGILTYPHLCLVGIATTVATIAFTTASGAHLKALVPADQRVAAASRLDGTSWAATVLGAPLGGLLIGWLGATATLAVDAVSYLVSAAGVGAIGSSEPEPPARDAGRGRATEILAGWRHVGENPRLRALFVNAMVFGGAVMAASPLQAVLMLRDLGFAPWQYGLALGLPGLGGLLGAVLAPYLVARLGEHRVLLGAGAARTLWLAPVALAPPGPAGVVTLVCADTALLLCAGVFNPTFVSCRLRETGDDHLARVTAAWSITAKVVQPAFVLAGGVLAAVVGTRGAIGVAAALLLASALALPWRSGRAPRLG
ncbi:MFS transporter [Arsenicicoccus dermatophilus]|uniref:MFS transporter n=1 Tax=Arsenicicoccus dermatophilus TaxID=1076331 RepID=UPI0039174A46